MAQNKIILAYMKPHTFILFGRAGSGKGTQAQNIINYLKKKDPDNNVIYIETGSKLREFADEVGQSAELTKKVMATGGLLPSFIPIWIWTNIFVRHMAGHEHLVLDGLSRRLYEAPVLDDALKFYNRENPIVISIEVSREWSRARLEARGRSDDNARDIEERLNWYDTNVLPTIEYFKTNPHYHFVSVNGEQSIEEVSKELLEKAGI